MVRKVDVSIPKKYSDKILEILKMNKHVHHLHYYCGFNYNNDDIIFISFKIVNKKVQDIIDVLNRYNVANAFGTIDVLSLTASKPRPQTIKIIDQSSSSLEFKKKKRKYKLDDRLAYEEIYDKIDGQLHLTFDYLALITVAGLISAVGLVTDSSVSVVASMLVSPLMGPILGMTFGTVINDKQMVWKSFRNEFIGVFLCWIVGFIFGLSTSWYVNSNPKLETLGMFTHPYTSIPISNRNT